MSLFPLDIDEEFLKMGAVQIDNNVCPVLKDLLQSNNKIEFINAKNETRVFNINWSDGTIEGRGIKGFFLSSGCARAFLEPTEDGKLRLLFPSSIDSDQIKKLGIPLYEKERVLDILHRLMNHQQDSEQLFTIFEKAKYFSSGNDYNNLICLPHLREMAIFNYQVKTVQAVLNRFRGRVLLCDEVGLGKTVEAGMAMLEYIMRGLAKKILILVPPSLVEQWHNELKRKFNQDFIRFDDPEFKKLGNDAWKVHSKVISSITTAKRKPSCDVISEIHYDLIIIDEAHHLKNRKTMAWQFVNNLKKKYIYLLTATPVQNNLEELYNLITLIKPGQLKTYTYFKKQFVEDKEGIKAKNVNQLKDLLSSVMIRNRRNNVDVKFTRRFASTHAVNILEEELNLYNQISNFIRERYNEQHPTLSRFVLKSIQEEMGSSFHVLNETLARLLSNEKLPHQDKITIETFLDTSRKVIENNKSVSPKLLKLYNLIVDFKDKMIIFTKYKTTQQLIVNFLRTNKIVVAQFHGGLKRKEKEEQIALFQNNAQILVSTEVGGEGRNLQFCNGMINFDLPWNPMAIEQRIGRIHRVGQTRDIHVHNLAANNTLEHYILDILDRKINMFELVVGEVDMILGDIEEDEDFSDIIMNAWTSSHDMSEVKKQIDLIGEKLLENKKQYEKVKELDDNIFGSSLIVGE